MLAQPPFHLSALAFVALIPWALWTAALPASVRGGRAALRGGLLLGAVYHGLVLHWLLGAFLWFTFLAPLGYLAVVGILAGLTGVAGRVLHLVVVRRGAPLWLALPAVWTVLEWVPSLPGDFSFPWLGLAAALTAVPELLGPAELGGELAVTFWIALVGGLGAEGIRRLTAAPRLHSPWAPLVVLPIALGVPALWSVHRAATLELEPGVRVAALRLPPPTEVRSDRRVRAREAAGHVEELLSGVQPGSVDLVLWPEAAFPILLDRADGAPFLEAARRHARRLGVPMLVGAYLAEEGPLNALVVVGADGDLYDHYGKRRLVPGVEALPRPLDRLPGGPPYGGGPTGEGFRPGQGSILALPGGIVVGPLVCWEAIFSGPARTARLGGARVLVNGTNDSFLQFPGTGRWSGRAARRQHEAHLVLRAVETRTGAVRAATAGGSFVVDPAGRIAVRTADVGTGLAVAEASRAATLSLHTRVGFGVGVPALLLLVLLAGAGRREPGSGGRGRSGERTRKERPT